ncbi:MAG TPA: hypothetical protein DCL31_08060 [Clostridium sp.]|nr:hypothetical protein [Clostridium sp.]
MKILITGSNGFVGKNLISELHNRGFQNIYKVTRETNDEQLENYCEDASIVFHLAGINRSTNNQEFEDGNVGFTNKLLNFLRKKI